MSLFYTEKQLTQIIDARGGLIDWQEIVSDIRVFLQTVSLDEYHIKMDEVDTFSIVYFINQILSSFKKIPPHITLAFEPLCLQMDTIVQKLYCVNEQSKVTEIKNITIPIFLEEIERLCTVISHVHVVIAYCIDYYCTEQNKECTPEN